MIHNNLVVNTNDSNVSKQVKDTLTTYHILPKTHKCNCGPNCKCGEKKEGHSHPHGGNAHSATTTPGKTCNCGPECKCKGKTGGDCNCGDKKEGDTSTGGHTHSATQGTTTGKTCNCGPECKCKGKTGGECNCGDKKEGQSSTQVGQTHH